MNPADLTLPTISPSLTAKTLPTPQSSTQKNGKAPVPRVDLEPIYTQLKAALGDGWAEYKAAVNAFVLGNLNQAELSWVLQPLLTAPPSAVSAPGADAARPPVPPLHLHNTLVTSLYANILRDRPPTDVAPWVVATDKPSATSKNAGAGGANDKAKERLKREVMALPARDRRRIKNLKGGTTPLGALNDGLKDIQAYHQELAVKPHSTGVDPAAAQSVGGMGKTNWDLEIRRRYAQPLASETLEFPTISDVQDRIEPIAAEEGLLGSTQSSVQACAELVEQATEVYLKEMLGSLLAHARSNGEGCIQTAHFQRQRLREEAEAERGQLQRNPAGLLPVEMDMQNKREPLDMQDLRLAFANSDTFLTRDPFGEETSWLKLYPALDEADDATLRMSRTSHSRPVTNGSLSKEERASIDDPMVLDEHEYWHGGTTAARTELMDVLDGCLAVR